MKNEKPTRIFRYPGGEPMCQDGLVRAAEYGQQMRTGQKSAKDIEAMAQKGLRATESGADTHKRNLIAHMVFFIFRHGDLDKYVNEEGEFVTNSGEITSLEKYEKVAKRFR